MTDWIAHPPGLYFWVGQTVALLFAVWVFVDGWVYR